MQKLNQTVVDVLKTLPQKELSLAHKVIRRAITKKVPIEKALVAEQFTPGDKVVYKDHSGELRKAVVRKVNQVRIRLLDKKTEHEISVLPEKISMVQRQAKAPRVKDQEQAEKTVKLSRRGRPRKVAQPTAQ